MQEPIQTEAPSPKTKIEMTSALPAMSPSESEPSIPPKQPAPTIRSMGRSFTEQAGEAVSILRAVACISTPARPTYGLRDIRLILRRHSERQMRRWTDPEYQDPRSKEEKRAQVFADMIVVVVVICKALILVGLGMGVGFVVYAVLRYRERQRRIREGLRYGVGPVRPGQ